MVNHLRPVGRRDIGRATSSGLCPAQPRACHEPFAWRPCAVSRARSQPHGRLSPRWILTWRRQGAGGCHAGARKRLMGIYGAARGRRCCSRAVPDATMVVGGRGSGARRSGGQPRQWVGFFREAAAGRRGQRAHLQLDAAAADAVPGAPCAPLHLISSAFCLSSVCNIHFADQDPTALHAWLRKSAMRTRRHLIDHQARRRMHVTGRWAVAYAT